tara:strand:- start:24 stop:1484 length:1461 start_codon:yes stop_codon:yes gene_type:complete
MGLRGASSPGSSGDASKALTSAGKTGNIRILHIAVVSEVFSNPAALTPKQKNDFKTGAYRGVSNSHFIDTMPRNSISAILIDPDSGAALSDTPMVLYPFFSAHLAMPVKPGEKVFVIFPSATSPGEQGGSKITSSIGFWITRITTNIDIDDVNYTHQDRVVPIKAGTSLVDRYSGTEAATLGFPNGTPGDPSRRTLPSEDGYDQIVKGSYAFRKVSLAEQGTWEGKPDQSAPNSALEWTGEPVPRFSKDCADLVLQGSNNTLIRLGRDTAPAGRESETPAQGFLAGTGTIDIVAGRGAITGTTPASALNDREYEETDKNPANSISTEGAANLEADLSRVYVSMKTSPDAALGLSYSHSVPAAEEVPSIIIKSDEVRLVARETGSVRLVKEGGTCELSMLPDNTVAINGSKVYLGLNSLGVETQPAVMGKLLETALHNFADDLLSALTVDACGNLATPLVDISFTTLFEDLKTKVTLALSSTVYVKD